MMNRKELEARREARINRYIANSKKLKARLAVSKSYSYLPNGILLITENGVTTESTWK